MYSLIQSRIIVNLSKSIGFLLFFQRAKFAGRVYLKLRRTAIKMFDNIKHFKNSTRTCIICVCTLSALCILYDNTTATFWGSRLQLAHNPLCVSSSQTGQFTLLKYCEIVP